MGISETPLFGKISKTETLKDGVLYKGAVTTDADQKKYFFFIHDPLSKYIEGPHFEIDT